MFHVSTLRLLNCLHCLNNCKFCSYSTERADLIRRHIKSLHTKCKYCDFVTASKKESIDKHIHDKHNNEYMEQLALEENKKKGFESDSEDLASEEDK